MIKMIDLFLALAHDHVDNYVIPGLRSSMITDLGARGKVRLFQMTRHQCTTITPHSHRYDLQCTVLRGEVRNTTWHPSTIQDEGDLFKVSEQFLKKGMKPNSLCRYDTYERNTAPFYAEVQTFRELEDYWIAHGEIHSIEFSKGAVVLVVESETKADSSLFIEPVDRGVTIQTMKTEGWMFRRSES